MVNLPGTRLEALPVQLLHEEPHSVDFRERPLKQMVDLVLVV